MEQTLMEGEHLTGDPVAALARAVRARIPSQGKAAEPPVREGRAEDVTRHLAGEAEVWGLE